MKQTKKTLTILAALILSIGSANAQGVEGVFKSAKRKVFLPRMHHRCANI